MLTHTQGLTKQTDAGVGFAESYHAGVVRKLLFDAKDQIEPQTGLTIRQLTDAIAELYTKISSVPQTGIAASLNGILHPVSAPADGKGLVYSRTPQQVNPLFAIQSVYTTDMPSVFEPEPMALLIMMYRIMQHGVPLQDVVWRNKSCAGAGFGCGVFWVEQQAWRAVPERGESSIHNPAFRMHAGSGG